MNQHTLVTLTCVCIPPWERWNEQEILFLDGWKTGKGSSFAVSGKVERAKRKVT
jgi:hypothetical protein